MKGVVRAGWPSTVWLNLPQHTSDQSICGKGLRVETHRLRRLRLYFQSTAAGSAITRVRSGVSTTQLLAHAMMSEELEKLEPITQATVIAAWVIVFNKPFYPVHVWYLVGSGVTASFGTLLSAHLFLAIPFLARRSPFAARIALPLIGTFDTLFETNCSALLQGRNCTSPPASCLSRCLSKHTKSGGSAQWPCLSLPSSCSRSISSVRRYISGLHRTSRSP